MEDDVDALELGEHLLVDAHRLAVGGVVAQHLERTLDAGERVLDLVRQAGGELPEARELIDVGEADGDVGLALALPGEELAQPAVDLGGDRIERQRRARDEPGSRPPRRWRAAPLRAARPSGAPCTGRRSPPRR